MKGLDGRKDTKKLLGFFFFIRVQGKVFLDYLNGEEMNWGLEERAWR